MYVLMFIAGCAVASACWWIYVRGLHGVISDLNDAKSQAQGAVKKAEGK